MTREQALSALSDNQKRAYAYGHAMNAIYLDSVTTAPRDTAAGRGEALEVLSGESYRITTDPLLSEALDTLAGDPALTPEQARQVELLTRRRDRLRRIPEAEYVAFDKLLNDAQNVWHDARLNNDFPAFAPYLETIVGTLARFAAYTDGDRGLSVYDSLLDQYERGLRCDALDRFFGALRETVVPLTARILEAGSPVRTDFLDGVWPVAEQRILSDRVMDLLGIDRSHCAIGETLHPFTLEFNKYDVRITTRYDERALTSSLYSVVHEGGHALYELNGSDSHLYTCLAGGVSMGVHEAQSRLYENVIGRSRGFVGLLSPILREIFPGRFDGVSDEELYRAVNLCQPSLIRTEADELTYPLHVMVRYEIEQGLFDGTYRVRDLPEIWGLKMKEFLGVDVPDDARGVLQDSHWSGGSFGYFPSYAIGSAYAAQLRAKMCEEFDFDGAVAAGRIPQITAWLTDRIYRHGCMFDPAELMERCFGGPFDPAFYTSYLTEKFSELYGV